MHSPCTTRAAATGPSGHLGYHYLRHLCLLPLVAVSSRYLGVYHHFPDPVSPRQSFSRCSQDHGHAATQARSYPPHNHRLLSMSQSPASSSMFKASVTTASSSNFNTIFDKALKAYTKKTKQDLTAHPLATQLKACDSPAAFVTILQDQIDQFRRSHNGDERMQRWLSPTINVLYAFSATLGQGVGMVSIN